MEMAAAVAAVDGGGSSSGGGKDRVVAVAPMAVKAEEGTDELMPTPPGSTVWLHANAASVTGYKGSRSFARKARSLPSPTRCNSGRTRACASSQQFGSALEGAVFYSEYLRITGRHLHPGAAGTDPPAPWPGKRPGNGGQGGRRQRPKALPLPARMWLGYRGIFYDQNRGQPQHRFTASASQNGRNRVLGRFCTAI